MEMEAEFFKTGMNSVKKGRFGFVLVNDPNMDNQIFGLDQIR